MIKDTLKESKDYMLEEKKKPNLNKRKIALKAKKIYLKYLSNMPFKASACLYSSLDVSSQMS